MATRYQSRKEERSGPRFDGTAVSNTFNSDGLLSSANAACTVSNGWNWNFANRLTDVKVTGLVSSPLSLSYGYYPAGDLSNMTSVAGALTLTYDEAEIRYCGRISAFGICGRQERA